MPDPKAFIDTNVLIYLLSSDLHKADQAEAILQSGGLISVQVLNELANVTRKKLSMSWARIGEFLALIRTLCSVETLSVETHTKGMYIADRYGLSVNDSMIVASALIADCKVLYSEDMQDGQLFENELRIFNPFT